jgi:hypothetical protein
LSGDIATDSINSFRSLRCLFAANHYSQQEWIKSNLEQGNDVVLDRYVFSNLVYGLVTRLLEFASVLSTPNNVTKCSCDNCFATSYDGGNYLEHRITNFEACLLGCGDLAKETVDWLSTLADGCIVPDYVFLLDVDQETFVKRRNEQKRDMYEKGTKMLRWIRHAYDICMGVPFASHSLPFEIKALPINYEGSASPFMDILLSFDSMRVQAVPTLKYGSRKDWKRWFYEMFHQDIRNVIKPPPRCSHCGKKPNVCKRTSEMNSF